jgi:excisionase family DNA binding protein
MQDMQTPERTGPPVTLLTTQDVQRLMKVDRSTVYRMAEDGRLPAVKVGRQWRFPEDLIHDLLRCRPAASAVPAPDASPGLAEALGPGALQAVSDLLAESLGTMVVVTDLEGHPLVAPSNPCGLFDAVHRFPGVLERCVDSWQDLAAEVDLDPQWRVTPLGFLCARSLVRDGGRLIGMILAGGVAPTPWPPAPEDSARLATGLGVPALVIEEHSAEVFHLDDRERERVLRLLPRSAAFLSRLAAPKNGPAGRSEPTAAPAAAKRQRSEP